MLELTTHIKPAGDPTKYSDRKEMSPGDYSKFAVSRSLVFPIRLNIGTLLKGQTKIKAQYPETAFEKEIDIATLELPNGKPAFIKASEYILPQEEKPAIETNAPTV